MKIGDTEIDLDSFYTPKETSRILGMSSDTINREVREGNIIRSGTPRIFFYKGQAIVNFLNRRIK